MGARSFDEIFRNLDVRFLWNVCFSFRGCKIYNSSKNASDMRNFSLDI